jgi:hypothetical protein
MMVRGASAFRAHLGHPIVCSLLLLLLQVWGLDFGDCHKSMFDTGTCRACHKLRLAQQACIMHGIARTAFQAGRLPHAASCLALVVPVSWIAHCCCCCRCGVWTLVTAHMRVFAHR